MSLFEMWMKVTSLCTCMKIRSCEECRKIYHVEDMDCHKRPECVMRKNEESDCFEFISEVSRLIKESDKEATPENLYDVMKEVWEKMS